MSRCRCPPSVAPLQSRSRPPYIPGCTRGCYLEMDAKSRTCRYLDQVEPTSLSTRLTELAQRLRRIDPWIIDLVLGTVFVIVGLIGLFAPDPHNTFLKPNGLAVFLTVLTAAPYYVRRRAPLPVLMITHRSGRDPGRGRIPDWRFAELAARRPLHRRRLHGFGRAAAGCRDGFHRTRCGRGGRCPDLNGTAIALNYALFAASYFVGSTIRNRRHYTEQLEERAATARTRT